MSTLRHHTHILTLARVSALVGAFILAVSFLPSDGTAARSAEVRTRGDNRMIPNAMIQSTLKFAPGHVSVVSGETLTLSHTDKTLEPHTLSVVDESELPTTVDEVFACGAPGTVCDDIFSVFPGEPTDSIFVDAPGTAAGLDGRLDSLFVLPGDSVSAAVTAAPGSTLFYLCAIHPWMQGQIDVR